MIRRFIASLSLLTIILMTMGAAPLVHAAGTTTDNTSKSAACAGVSQLGSGADCTTDSSSSLSNLLRTVIDILSIVVGFAAVIMIIIAGFKYITSGGDSSNVSSAKNTLIYALVGIIIVILSQAIVHFVLAKATALPAVGGSNTTCTPGSKDPGC